MSKMIKFESEACLEKFLMEHPNVVYQMLGASEKPSLYSQVYLGVYGVADIIAITTVIDDTDAVKAILIDVIELKNVNPKNEDWAQVNRYVSALVNMTDGISVPSYVSGHILSPAQEGYKDWVYCVDNSSVCMHTFTLDPIDGFKLTVNKAGFSRGDADDNKISQSLKDCITDAVRFKRRRRDATRLLSVESKEVGVE